jgi:hypothetical protein
MAKQLSSAVKEATLKTALRRRVRDLYRSFNLGEFARCFHFLDPRLREAGKVEPEAYSQSLSTFKNHYGTVNIWLIRISLYADTPTNKRADRPFAYVYVVWQDLRNEVHLFRERWVYDSGRWYTRVVGRVAHEGTNGKQD